jgi:tRNA modification GTPase
LAQPPAWDELMRRKSGIGRGKIKRILDDRSLHWLLHPPRVAIVGPANAGKSTLANQLFAQERSITADLPGTTRDWVGAIANIDGLAVTLLDTPGLRDTRDAVEAEAIALARPQIARADLVVLVLDQTRPLAGGQEQLLAQFRDALVVVNKSDYVAIWHAAFPAIHTVATTGRGLAELRRAVQRRFGCELIDIGRARCWTERQRALLERAAGMLA